MGEVGVVSWRETPIERRYHARRLDHTTGDWLPCEYSELRAGDFFQAYTPDGERVDPVTLEPVDEDVVAYAHENPIKGGGGRRCEGYAIEVSVGPFDVIMRSLRQ